jgi:hypothetical protein
MMNEADLAGLTEEQALRYEQLDREMSQSREGIVAWHRLLDRRRLDRKRGLHPITEFGLGSRPHGAEQGGLIRRERKAESHEDREPFYLHSEAEARGLLLRCVGYLSTPDGEKIASDKGPGGRDKIAEWIMHEIRTDGALAYVVKHAPYVFGIRLAVANA